MPLCNASQILNQHISLVGYTDRLRTATARLYQSRKLKKDLHQGFDYKWCFGGEGTRCTRVDSCFPIHPLGSIVLHLRGQHAGQALLREAKVIQRGDILRRSGGPDELFEPGQFLRRA